MSNDIQKQEGVNFSIEEIQMRLGQKDMEIILLQRTINQLNIQIKEMKKELTSQINKTLELKKT